MPRVANLCCCLLLLAVVSQAWAQSGNEAAILGVVLDPSGAAVPGVAITARNSDIGIRSVTITDHQGLFRFSVLPVGIYQISAQHSGFANLSLNDVALNVGAKLNLTLRLKLAGAMATVDVSDSTPAVENTRSDVSSTIDSHFITNLPVNGRDFAQFVLLTPGVTWDARGGLSFGGQRAMNSLLVDGLGNDDNYWGQPLGDTGFFADGRQPYYISQDAVQEFQVKSNAYSAEFGRAGGGVINAVTKSGTNAVHGSAFWFYRDRSMNATDAVNKLHDLPKGPFHFNQFGGTLGGPVRRDRLFFFFSYEGMRSNLPNAVFLNLPSGFHLSADPTIASYQQTALDYLRPRARSWVWPVSQNDYLARTDWSISPMHRMAVLWLRQRYTGGGGLDAGAQNGFEHTDGNPVSTDFASVSLTSALADHAVNIARFGYLRTFWGLVPVSTRPEALLFERGQAVLLVGRNAGSGQEIRVNQAQWSDTLNYNHGHHTLKAGVDVLMARMNFFYTLGFSGSYTFTSLESFGRSMSGQPAPRPQDSYQQSFSATATPGVTTHPNTTAVAGFVQEEWSVRPNLTFNLGLRYDLQMTAKPSVKNPSPSLAAAGLDTSTLPLDINNVAPRLGIAWSPFSNNRLLLRVGYGVFYALTPSTMVARADLQNDIAVQTRTLLGSSSNASLIPAYPNTICGPPDPSGAATGCAAPPIGASNPILQLFSSQFRQPYVQQSSAGFEIRLPKELNLSVTYLRTTGSELQQVRDINLDPQLVTASVGIADTSSVLTYQRYPSQRPIAEFDRILLFGSTGRSVYNALAIGLNKHFSYGFQALGSYTFAKVVDNNPNVYALNPGRGNPFLISYPSNPTFDRGPGANDQRHRLVLSGVYEVAPEAGLPTVGKRVLKGWQIGAILAAQSGKPYSGLIGYDLNNDGDFATDRTPRQSRNMHYMPASVSLDTRVTRTVSLSKTKLQFIAEGFNLLNHTNTTSVNSTQFVVSPAPIDCGIAITPCLVPQNEGLNKFGTLTATSGPRVLQLAIRVSF